MEAKKGTKQFFLSLDVYFFSHSATRTSSHNQKIGYSMIIIQELSLILTKCSSPGQSPWTQSGLSFTFSKWWGQFDINFQHSHFHVYKHQWKLDLFHLEVKTLIFMAFSQIEVFSRKMHIKMKAVCLFVSFFLSKCIHHKCLQLFICVFEGCCFCGPIFKHNFTESCLQSLNLLNSYGWKVKKRFSVVFRKYFVCVCV